ncbi:MAG: hypothetical protein IJX23_05485, partial [Clostridia bacterium]|nr:hypothetical protein [Clostridia bacterium]
MKDRKTLQKVFGIMCALMALALGTVTVLVILPYLGGDLVRGLFDRMTAGLATIADTTKIPELLILLVAFIAPTILLAISAGKLLGGKSGRTVFEGSVVALVAFVLVGSITAIFSKPLFVHWQWLYLTILGLGAVLFGAIFVLTLLAVKREGDTSEPTEKCNPWQKGFGIMCTLMTVALGTVTLMMYVPYLGGKLANGVFLRMFNGLESIAVGMGISGLTLILIFFALPTLLLAGASVLLLHFKRDRLVVTGSGLALGALLVVGLFTAICSKPLFVHWQWLYLVILVLGCALFGTVLAFVLLPIKRRHCPCATVAEPTPVEEPVEEPTPLPEPTPIEEPTPVEQPAATPAPAVETEKQGVLVIGDEEVLVRYNRSFTSKLMQASDELKGYYADLVNHALSYKKVKNRISWPSSTIKHQSGRVAILTIKGKTLYVYLAMDPELARQTIKGTIKDVSDKKRYQTVPTLFKVRSPLSLRKAKRLLDALMSTREAELGKPSTAINPQDYPYETTEDLIKNGLIKVRAVDGHKIEEGKILRAAGFGMVKSVTAEQAHNMIADSVASTLVQTSDTTTVSVKGGRKFAINIDTLSQNFDNGYVVTIDALK